MIKPLVISRSYLWDKSSTGQIQRVFWEYAFQQGMRPTILCSKSRHNDVQAESVKCNIIPTYDSQFVRYVIAFLKRVIAEELAYTPDYSYFSWYKISATRRAKKEACSGKYDYIHSVCTPFSGHLVALEAKKASGLPWIASFYDPWYENPYRPIRNPNLKARDKFFEAEVAKNADIILHTNQAIFEEWINRYGEGIRDKMFVQPLVFNNSKSIQETSSVEHQKFIISHIGSLYPNRDSADFLKALHFLLNEHPELKDCIILNYVGTVTDCDRRYVEMYDFTSFTHFVGFIKEEECKEYFEQSDLFIAIDGKDGRNIFFPSKIMKYFYYGKPILGMTPKGSALQFELEKSHNFCFENEDYQGIADFLYRSIVEKGFPSGNDKEYWINFTMEKVYPDYLNILSQVLKR